MKNIFLLLLAISVTAADRPRKTTIALTPQKSSLIIVDAGANQTIPGPSAEAALSATVLPTNIVPIVDWSVIEGPTSAVLETQYGLTNLVTFDTAGNYTIMVRATYGAYRNYDTVSVFINDQGITNFIPKIQLINPPNGSTFTAPIDLLLSANATDKDGTVARVVYYNATVPIATSTVSPFTAVFPNAPATNYGISAVATDNRGATNISTTHAVVVNPAPPPPPIPPTVEITSPANGATFTAPTNFVITATATDSDGTIANVTFKDGSTVLGVDAFAPYSTSINPTVGTHQLTATALDNDGLSSTASISITVDNPPAPTNEFPIISLTAPVDGSTYTAPASITISAVASDSDGTIANVQFFSVDSQSTVTLLGTDTTAPYSITLSGVAVGSYSYFGVVRDNIGATATSYTNSVVVNPGPGVPPTITLDYPTNSQAFKLGTIINLQATAADDGSVTNVLWYDTFTDQPTPSDPRIINDNDAGITYSGSWTYNTAATGRINNDEHYSHTLNGFFSFTFNGTDVKWIGTKFSNRGKADVYIDNVLRDTIDEYSASVQTQVELYSTNSMDAGTHTIKIVCRHEKNASSTEYYIDVDAIIYRPPATQGPTVTTLITNDTTAPYSKSWTPAQGGHAITAVAWDNIGLSATSSPPANITVNPLSLPYVLLTSPTNGQKFTVGDPIPMTATASDSDGVVTNVAFWQYNPDMFITNDTTDPYTGTWNGAGVGQWSLIAKAQDDDGQIGVSTAVMITVGTNSVYVDAGPNQTAALSVYQPYFDTQYATYSNNYNGVINTGNGQALYDSQALLEAAIKMYEATLDTNYLNRAVLWAETLVTKCTINTSEGFKSWPGNWASSYSTNKISFHQEEEQGSIAPFRVSRIILENPRLDAIWHNRATNIYTFFLNNFYRKQWYGRNQASFYTAFFLDPSRTQSDKGWLLMSSLLEMVKISALLGGADNNTYGLPTVLNMAAQGNKDYQGVQARFTSWKGGLVWDKGKLYTASGSGGSANYYILDTSHAERVPAAVLAAYKDGVVYDINTLNGLAYTFANTIFTNGTASPLFSNFHDGDNQAFLDRGPYAAGKIYWAWSQLGEIDTNCFVAAAAMLRLIKNGGSNLSSPFNNSFYGRAELAGNLARCVTRGRGYPPYAILSGTVGGSGITSTTWTRTSGPGSVQIINSTSPVATALFGTNVNVVGTHVFQLRATTASSTNTDTVSVSMLAAPAF